jgi:hypothetical protein
MSTWSVTTFDSVCEVEADYWQIIGGILLFFDRTADVAHTAFKEWVSFNEHVTIH